MKSIAILVAVVLLAGCAGSSPSFDADRIKTTIQADMEQQAKDWSAGNLEGFMQGYHQSPDLRLPRLDLPPHRHFLQAQLFFGSSGLLLEPFQLQEELPFVELERIGSRRCRRSGR